MTEAVIVSTARTPIGKAYKGALNNTVGATLLGHAISAALSRANVAGADVDCDRPLLQVQRAIRLLNSRGEPD